MQFQYYGEKANLVYREMKLLLPGGGGTGGIITRGWGFWYSAKNVCHLTQFLDIQFKNIYNFILLSFKVPSERFFRKFFKTVLTF